MIQIKQSTTLKVPVALVSNADHTTPVTGKTGGDVTITYVKSDGTTSNFPLTGTFTEVTANAFSGLGVYQLTIPSSVSDVVGPLSFAVSCSGADTSKAYVDVVANLVSDVQTRLGTPAGASVSADIASVKSDTSAINTSVGINLGTNVSTINTKIGTPVATVSTDIAGVQTTVNTINTSVGSGLGTNVSAVKAKTDNLPGDPASESGITSAITAATSPLATASSLSTVSSNVTAVKAKTDNLPSDPASQSATNASITSATTGLATSSALSTVNTTVNTINTSVGSGLGTNVSTIDSKIGSPVSTVSGDIMDLQTDVTVLRTIATGRWKIFTTGPSANKIILYDVDGTTPLFTFDLKNDVGAPTATSAYERVPA